MQSKFEDLQAEFEVGFQSGQQDIIDKLPRFTKELVDGMAAELTLSPYWGDFLSASSKRVLAEILKNKMLEVFK